MKHLLGQIRVLTMSAGLIVCAAGAIAEPTKATGGGASTPGNTSTAKPADVKAKPRKVGQTDALTKAIAELNKEFKEFAAKPDGNALRTSSDYFKGEMPADTTVEDVLSVLNSNLSGPPTQVAYVKWQLLSACPAKFDDKDVRAAFQAYGRAPAPIPAFSSEAQVRSQLDRALQGLKADETSDLEKKFSVEKDKIDAANEPILGYRNGLYARLPVSPDSILAALGDLTTRIEAGVETKATTAFFTTIASDIRGWAAVDAKPDQINGMLAELRKLKNWKASTTIYSGKITTKKMPFTWDKETVGSPGTELEFAL